MGFTVDTRELASDRGATIVFHDKHESGISVAHKLVWGSTYHIELGDVVEIHDQDSNVIIHSEAHAKELMKALNLAIQLGWFKK